MMYLGIRTDSPVAEFYVYEASVCRAEMKWEANRELARDILAQLETFLHTNDLTFTDINGLFVYRGPGSFTGLRIGISVMNTMSYGLGVPIVGGESEGWVKVSVERLERGENDTIVLPEYGAPARITSPKK